MLKVVMQGMGNLGDPRVAWVHAGADITPEPSPVRLKTHEVGTLHFHFGRGDACQLWSTYPQLHTSHITCVHLRSMLAGRVHAWPAPHAVRGDREISPFKTSVMCRLAD